MTKLDEMWTALAAYQPQADAAGHGKSWARMCSLRTYDAAYVANAAAEAAAARAADTAAAAADVAAYAVAAAGVAAADSAAADFADSAVAWAQKAINRIKSITIPAQPAEQEPVAFDYFKDWMVKEMPPMTTIGNPEWWAKRIYERFIYTTPPAAQPPQREPLADVIKAAQGVLESTEIAHRPPLRDLLEVGRMVKVRLHALADLKDALAAHGIKEKP